MRYGNKIYKWMLLAEAESLDPLLPSLVEDEGGAAALMFVCLFGQK